MFFLPYCHCFHSTSSSTKRSIITLILLINLLEVPTPEMAQKTQATEYLKVIGKTNAASGYNFHHDARELR
jgi:hypothetical protein